MKKLLLLVAALYSFFGICTHLFADDQLPHVISTNPRDGAENVTNPMRVQVTFSEAIDPGSVDSNDLYMVTDSGSEQVEGSISCSGNTATFAPFNDLYDLTAYRVTVAGSITGVSGQTLQRDYSFTFTTASN